MRHAHMVCEVESKFNAESYNPFLHSADMEPRALLQALMDRDKDNPHSLATKLKGRPAQPQIYKFLHGVAKEPRRTNLAPLAKHFRIPLDALYDPDKAQAVAVDLGLIKNDASPQDPPNPDDQVPQQYRQLLIDLEDIPPAKRSRLLDQIHQAAEESREAADHLIGRETAKAANARRAAQRQTTSVTWGDGNERQTSLPLATVKDPFTAAPSERERKFYTKVEKAPKAADRKRAKERKT